MADYGEFMGKNSFSVPYKSVKIYPFWKTYGAGKSYVNNLRFEKVGFVAEFGSDDKKYFFDVSSETYKEIKDFSKKDNSLLDVIKNVPMPKAAGRNFKAVATACAELKDGRIFVGTKDGMMGIWNGCDMYSLGSCPNCSGEVVDLCYCEKTNTIYGIIGSVHDIGIVFSYNDKKGVEFLGRMNFTADNGLASSCELSCIAVSDDGREIAVGNKDRLGVLYVLKI